MRNRLTALSMAVIACAIFSCTSAAVAMASSYHFESSPSFLAGEQATKIIFTTNGWTMKCNTAVFESRELVGTSASEIELAPEFGGCTLFGQALVFDPNGCAVVWDGANGRWKHRCPTTFIGGQEIKDETVITAPTSGCKISFPEQAFLSSLSFTNEGSGSTRRVLVTFNVTGISYTSTGGICGASGTNGKLTGSVLLKAYSDAGHTTQRGIWWE